uniref:Transmembrane protein 238-like n=1 Tax=Sus scrofa TaxID=9823 RepID=A0A4X1U239_PIG
MELPINDIDQTKNRRGLGRCRHFFWLGVAFDTVGATVLLTGVFANLLFYDLLLYLGSIIIFLSLLWWVFWYSANIELPSEEPTPRPYHLPSATTLEILSQTISNRFSFSIGNVSSTFMRMRHRRQCRRRILPESASMKMTVTGQLGQLDQEDQVKDQMESAKESDAARDIEDLPQPEAVKSAEEVCSLGPSPGALGPKTSLPSTHQVQPQLTPSSLDQPLTPAILASKSLPVVPLASMSQPVLILTSKSQLPAATLASRNQPDVPLPSASQSVPVVTSKKQPVVLLAAASQAPAVTLASRSQPAVPLSSTNQPLTILTSQSQPLVPVASQRHSVMTVTSQSHLLVPVAAQTQLQNLSQACQTQPPPVQASQAQNLATPVSLLQLLPTLSFQTQMVDPQVAQTIQDFQAMDHTQQATQSSSSVQRVEPGQSLSAQEFHGKSLAFKTPPPVGQKLSPNPPDVASVLPESPTPAAHAQESVSPRRWPTPDLAKKSCSL